MLDDLATSHADRDAAERTLRYLDCPESIHELARQITKPGQEDQWNFTAGLLGARNQALVLQELEARFTAPDAALTQNYLYLLGKAQFAHAHLPLPPYPLENVKEQGCWQSKRDALTAELTQADDELYQRAADTLVEKQGLCCQQWADAILPALGRTVLQPIS